MRKNIVIFICLFVLFQRPTFSQNSKPKPNSICIKVSYERDNLRDTNFALSVKVWDYIFGNSAISTNRTFISHPDNTGVYSFTVTDVNDFVYFSLIETKKQNNADHDRGRGLIELYLAQQGDTIFINIKNNAQKFNDPNNISFHGANAFAYTFQKEANVIERRITDSIFSLQKRVSNEFKDSLDYQRYYSEVLPSLRWVENRLHIIDSVQLSLLQSIKNKINGKFYNLLACEIVGKNERSLCLAYQGSYATMRKYITEPKRDSLRKSMKMFYCTENNISKGFNPDSGCHKSFMYIDYLINRAILESDYNFNLAFDLITSRHSGNLRDQLIVSFLSQNYTKILSIQKLMANAFAIVNFEPYLSQLHYLNEIATIGKPAFNFNLPDKNGRLVRLSDLKGKVVFIDFWYVGCISCLKYFKTDVSNAEQYFKNNPDVIFITICLNTISEDWKKALLGKQGIYTSDLALNLIAEGDIGKLIEEKYMVKGAPRPILVDRNGVIFSNNFHELRDNSNGKALINTIQRAVNMSK